MKIKATLLVVAGAVAPFAAGCSDSPATGESIDLTQATLRRAQSCEDLTRALRDDARSKMNRRIDAEIRAIREGYGSYGYAVPGAEDEAGPAEGAGASASAGAAPPPSTPSAPSAPSTSASPAPAHSDTETQVQGVDEADIVKADGTRLYVLHGQKLLIVNAWPAPTLGVAGGSDIEGEPKEMFVADGKAVVFSTVNGDPIYAAAGVVPRSSYSDTYSYGGYAPGVATAGGADSVGYYGGPSYAHALTKVTVLTIAGSTASVARELYFEGSYLSSRRVGSKVRVVLEGGAHGPQLAYSPTIVSTGGAAGGVAVGGAPVSSTPSTTPTQADQIAAWEVVRSKNDALIAATTYADWTPQSITKDGGATRATPTSCSDFYVPTAGSTEFGMTQIESFDLDAPADPPRSSAIVGAVETVYGDTTSMVLAGRAYVDPWTIRSAYAPPPAATTTTPNGAQPTTAPLPSVTIDFTHLHLFDLASDPSQALYAGSGTVPGSVKDQFSLDQKDGHVRVTTTETRTGAYRSDGKQNTVSHVFVLENRSGRLRIQGDAGPIAPGEQLYATRYVGDKAYVVTWHVTDPLFVVDLSNASRPTVLGQLQIPGFSEYMHPLDDTHLLTIGRETDDTGHQHTNGGYWYGIAIQLFDVTNPLQPKLQQKYVYDGGEYATTEAANNHKAFTYFDDKKLLAFPYVRQVGYGASATDGPSSTLEVFHVDVAGGIQKIGSVDHSSLLGTLPNGGYGYCGGYYDGAVRRGVFFENVVYSISYGGILANDVSRIATPLASLKLDAPVLQGLSCGIAE